MLALAACGGGGGGGAGGNNGGGTPTLQAPSGLSATISATAAMLRCASVVHDAALGIRAHAGAAVLGALTGARGWARCRARAPAAGGLRRCGRGEPRQRDAA